ncbi:MAG TPA: glycosyltransferase family 39 protein [Solirubrobacteraceae bacterium]|nr:glycosyltransferase family 39 protein [Solirubrobacteraceae bacterium]
MSPPSSGRRRGAWFWAPPTTDGRRLDLHRPALWLLLAATLGLRLWGIKQGLPYSYNSDEATHFVPRAIAFFSHDYNPQYFLNPPAYSYLLHFVFELWFGGPDAVRRAYAANPTDVYVVARVVAAVLGTVAVWLTYLAGERLFNRTTALLGAAVFGLGFLPIFYSHLALNDVPALAPVALSLYGVAGVLRNGARRDYVVAGVGIGLAAATKYTGAVTAVCLVAAAICDGAGGAPFKALRRLVFALACAVLAFIAANPYSVLDFAAFHAGVTTQQALAGGSDPEKLGTTAASGTAFYVWTFTWGLGWAPSIAALAGSAMLVVRRRLALAFVLLPAPIAFIVFMGDQQRYFGRWLMPVFPIIAVLAAYGAVEAARWLIRARRMPVVLAAGAVAVVMLGQSLAAAVHNDVVLSRADTRNVTRAWMVNHVPAGAKVVVEPLVSNDWGQDTGRSLPWTPSGARWELWNPYVTDVDSAGHHLPLGEHRYVAIDQYERTLRPELLQEYENSGYCWVVIGSLQAGRSFAQPKIAPAAIAYYAALSNQARLMFHISPFAKGDRAVPFSFDWSIDYYPRQYARPGPEMSVYRLMSGKCAPNYAPKGK